MMHSVVAALPRRCWPSPAIAGLRLAWAWYHRLAARPLGTAAGAVPDVRVQRPAGLGLGRRGRRWRSSRCRSPGGCSGANLLLVLGVLYAARGLAVVVGAVAGRRGRRWARC